MHYAGRMLSLYCRLGSRYIGVQQVTNRQHRQQRFVLRSYLFMAD